jgi:hypothetical protein
MEVGGYLLKAPIIFSPLDGQQSISRPIKGTLEKLEIKSHRKRERNIPSRNPKELLQCKEEKRVRVGTGQESEFFLSSSIIIC